MNYKWLETATPERVKDFIQYTEANLSRAKYRGGMLVMVSLWEMGLKKAKGLC